MLVIYFTIRINLIFHYLSLTIEEARKPENYILKNSIVKLLVTSGLTLAG